MSKPPEADAGSEDEKVREKVGMPGDPVSGSGSSVGLIHCEGREGATVEEAGRAMASVLDKSSINSMGVATWSCQKPQHPAVLHWPPCRGSLRWLRWGYRRVLREHSAQT